MMKALSFITLLLLSLSFSCNKDKNETCESHLVITKASVSPASGVSNGILFDLEAYGGNLCYSFKELSISTSGDKTYDIKVLANIPCKPAICAEALYQSTPSGSIRPVSAGTYTLRFFNGTTLFTTITVTI